MCELTYRIIAGVSDAPFVMLVLQTFARNLPSWSMRQCGNMPLTLAGPRLKHFHVEEQAMRLSNV
jgi:hypothetical protein